jgi:NTE family protein
VPTDFSDGQLLTQLGINNINIDFKDFTNQAYVQTVFIQKFLIGAGLEYKYLRIESPTLENNSPILEKSDYLSAFGYLKYDSFDNKYFPKRGWYFYGDAQSFLSSSNYTNTFNKFSIFKGDIGIVQTFYHKITLKVQSEAGFAIGRESVHFFDFVLGGYGYNTINNFKHFYGYDFLSISKDSYIKSCFTVDYEVYKKNHINFSANYANADDKLFKTNDWLAKPKYTGYAIGYGLESVFGPIEVKYSWSPELTKGFTWFSVGFWF